MTTLLDEGETLVVRCDECRRLWPLTRSHLVARWTSDDAGVLDYCPVCSDDEQTAARAQRVQP